MKILICSDTHRNSVLFQKSIDLAINHDATHLWHLGDDWDDVSLADTKGLFIEQVPGLWHENYHKPSISRIYSRDFGVFSTTMVHDISTIRPMFLTSDPWVFFHGHTHKPSVLLNKNKLTINPGHLKKSFDRGYEATALLMTVGDTTLLLQQLHPTSNTILGEITFTLINLEWQCTRQIGKWYGELAL